MKKLRGTNFCANYLAMVKISMGIFSEGHNVKISTNKLSKKGFLFSIRQVTVLLSEEKLGKIFLSFNIWCWSQIAEKSSECECDCKSTEWKKY